MSWVGDLSWFFTPGKYTLWVGLVTMYTLINHFDMFQRNTVLHLSILEAFSDLCNFNKNDTKDERWMDARWYPALNAQFNEYQRRHEWHRAKLNAVFHLPFGYASFPSVDIMQQLTTMWEPYKPIRCLGDCSFPLYSACVRMCKLATAHSLPLENGSLKVGQEYHKQNTIQFWL